MAIDSPDVAAPTSVFAGAPAQTAALALLLVGMAAFGAAALTSAELAHMVFFAVAVGLVTVSVAVLALRSLIRSPAETAVETLERLSRRGCEPLCLTDAEGRIRKENAAFSAIAGTNADRSTLPAALAGVVAEPDALVFRLFNRMSEAGTASEAVNAPDGTRRLLTVRDLGDGLHLWSMPSLPAANDPSREDSAATPVFVANGFGDILSANEAASALAGRASTLEDVLGVGPASHGAIIDLTDRGLGEVRIHLRALEGGRTEVLLLPHDPEEFHGTGIEALLESLPVALAQVGPDGRIKHANAELRGLLGTTIEPGTELGTLMEGLGRSIKERISDMVSGRQHTPSEMARASVGGREIFLQVTLKRLKLDGQTSLLAVITDATELKTLEAQFVQSQKMQAVGQLAGGVAHDFNNLLTAINGHCDLLLIRHQQGDSDYGDLVQIRQNANRAASLVGQLLAFSRKQTLLPRVLDLYNTFSDLTILLNRLLGEKVTLKIDNCSDLKPVRVDERQMEQVIMNLVVNARDAMPNGGEVTIRTRNVRYDSDQTRDRAVIPFGEYVQVDVIDTGVGIPPDKRNKIFEPFYTTKKTGEGTGLGLSTVYGIIKQTGGFIFVDSSPGVGSTFTILLPVFAGGGAEAAVPDTVEATREPRDLSGRGVVLLVEDELPVRSFAARALNLRGYTVVEAASAEEALDILEDEELHVDVFVSDVIMPGMDGPTWVRQAQKTRPDARVVFISGYAEDAFDGGELTIPNASFLPKPFSLNDLTEMVKSQICR